MTEFQLCQSLYLKYRIDRFGTLSSRIQTEGELTELQLCHPRQMKTKKLPTQVNEWRGFLLID